MKLPQQYRAGPRHRHITHHSSTLPQEQAGIPNICKPLSLPPQAASHTLPSCGAPEAQNGFRLIHTARSCRYPQETHLLFCFARTVECLCRFSRSWRAVRKCGVVPRIVDATLYRNATEGEAPLPFCALTSAVVKLSTKPPHHALRRQSPRAAQYARSTSTVARCVSRS